MDSDDERDEEAPAYKGIPGSVILINCFDPSDKNTSGVGHAATCRMVRQYLRVANSHLIGVCLYGTKDTDSTVFGTKGVVEIMPLSLPTLENFNKLRSTDVSTFEQAKDFELSDALWHCSKLFTKCKKQLSQRTVILLSRLDIPPVQTDQKFTFKRVNDLVDSNIDIKIINVSPEEYKVDEFYCNLLQNTNKGEDYILPKPIWDPKEIEQIMHQQSHRHLAIAQLSLEIGDGLSIGVGVYNLLVRSSQHSFSKKQNLDSETNAPVSSVTKLVKVSTDPSDRSTDTSAPGPSDPSDMEVDEPKELPLLKSEILHYLVYGGERVEFTDNERKHLRNPFGPPRVKLLGFKPVNAINKEKWFLKTGSFLYPNEKVIEGSTVAFKALHQACIESKVVAVCVLCTRVNAKSHIVALSPCTHPLGLDVEIGFDIIYIPFMENCRNLPPVEEDDQSLDISEREKNLMKSILTNIQFDYKPDMFENPKVQAEYRAIETLALEDEDIDPFVDTTKPNSEKFEVIPADLFEELFGPFGVVASKRPAGSRESTNTKRAKQTEGFDETELNYRVKQKIVEKYTVAQLKDIVKTYDPEIATTGLKKAQLVAIVYEKCAPN